jgi:PAS fold/GAF domain
MNERELERLNTVNRFLEIEISREDQLQQIVELAAKICDSPVALITFIDQEAQHVRFKVGTDMDIAPFQDTFCQYTVTQSDLLVIPDATIDARVSNNPYVLDNPNIRFYAGAPLTTHDDLNIGTLCVYDFKPKILTAMQEKMLFRLAKQVVRIFEFEASLHLLKQQYEFSRAEETKLRSFFESTSSCHLLLNTDLRVIFFNKAIVDLLKNTYQLEIAEGMVVTDYVESTFLDEFTLNCKRALKGEVLSLERVVASPLGGIPWQLTYEPAYNNEGGIIGVSYSATDITQSVRHDKKVSEQEESFRQINRILSAELSDPLAAIFEAMAGLKQQGSLDLVPEFNLLEIVMLELADKRKVVLSTDYESLAGAAFPNGLTK